MVSQKHNLAYADVARCKNSTFLFVPLNVVLPAFQWKKMLRNRCTCCQKWKPMQGLGSSVVWVHLLTLLLRPGGVRDICDRWIAMWPGWWARFCVLKVSYRLPIFLCL